MKKVYTLFILTLFALTLTGCYKYDGKEVATIVFESVDYNGGVTTTRTIDFTSYQVLEEVVIPYSGVLEEERTIATFDEGKVLDFLNEAGSAGLFNLKGKYSRLGIIDGSGWTLTINYSDGSTKVSTGDNASPTSIFKKVDYACYELFGDDLFSTLPSNYTTPERLSVTLSYTEGNCIRMYGASIAATNYTWRNECVSSIDNIDYANSNSPFSYSDDINYSLIIDTLNSESTINKMTISTCDLDGSNLEFLESYNRFNEITISLEMNKVYIITADYDEGTCEYALSTQIQA